MRIDDRIENIKHKVNEIKQKQAYQKVTAFMKKIGKETLEKYQGLSKKGKIILWSSLIASVSLAYGAVTVKNKIAEHKKEVKQKDFVQSKIDKLTAKHKIADQKSFDKLFNDAFPMIVASLLPTECMVLHPYSDNGICSNTIGVGMYEYSPDPCSKKEWTRTSKYFKDRQDTVISGNFAIA